MSPGLGLPGRARSGVDAAVVEFIGQTKFFGLRRAQSDTQIGRLVRLPSEAQHVKRFWRVAGNMTLNPDMLTAEELEALQRSKAGKRTGPPVHLAVATPAMPANVTIGYGR